LRTVYDNESAQLSVQASDADGDALSYSWMLAPGAGSISGGGDTVTYIPPTVTVQQVFTVTVTVSDGQGGQCQRHG
jgi:chitinase